MSAKPLPSVKVRRALAEAGRLAAEIGAADGDVYAAEEVAESSSFEVDVVLLARLPEETRTRIRESGEVLFTRGGSSRVHGQVSWRPPD